jgi:hypothetical protein
MTDGYPIRHSDSFRPSSAQGSGNYTTKYRYQEHPEKAEYGPVADRFTEELKLSHPAPDIQTLRRETHLAAQLHEDNRNQWETNSPFENDGSTLYDIALLEVADRALDVEGIDPSVLDVPERRFKTVFLKEARKPSALKDFYNYLENAEPVLAELGYDRPSEFVSYETLRTGANDRLPRELAELEGGRDAFEAAVVRAIYAAFRNGITPPDAVSTAYGFDAVLPPLYEKSVPRPTKKEALKKWVRLLLDETLQPLTFHRNQRQIEISQFVGLFAASALCDCGVQTVPDVVDYHENRATIPKGSGVAKYIDDLPLDGSEAAFGDEGKQSIVDQFDAVHRATLDLANERGFFDESLSLAVDMYRIDWNGANDGFTINRPPMSETDVRSQWTYAVLSIIDTDARFTLGTRWLPRKSRYPAAIRSMSSIPKEYFDVRAIYADSELISGNLINAFRGLADSDWVVRAPNHKSVISKLKRFTPANHIGYVPSVSWNTTPKPAAIVYPYDSNNPDIIEFTARQLKQAPPISSDEQTTILSEDANSEMNPELSLPTLEEKFDDPQSETGVGDPSTHAAYLTDRTLPERSGGGIHFRYYQRWAIEEFINEISNNMMPVIESGNPKLRLYGMNLAVLFQNWHTLINRAPSPGLGLRLDVTHQELFMAIQTVAFEDTT